MKLLIILLSLLLCSCSVVQVRGSVGVSSCCSTMHVLNVRSQQTYYYGSGCL